MTRIFTGSAVVSALLIAAPLSSAIAADIPLKAPCCAAEPSWTGFYFGATLVRLGDFYNVKLDNPGANFPVGYTSSGNKSGPLAGGQIGFDYQSEMDRTWC